jgi:hypothetical protein
MEIISREIRERIERELLKDYNLEYWRTIQLFKTEKFFTGRYRNWEHYCWNHLGQSPSRVDAILKVVQLLDHK